MSVARDLLDRLAEIGAKVETTDSHRLIVRAGPQPVPGELVQLLRDAKGEVLATLAPPWWRSQFVVRTIARERGGARSRAKRNGLLGASCNAGGIGCIASRSRNGNAPAAASLSAAERPCRSAMAAACISTQPGWAASSPMAGDGAVPRRGRSMPWACGHPRRTNFNERIPRSDPPSERVSTAAVILTQVVE
jgi:hypothetical protein